MSRVLCIAGMHRSGTSLAASWLGRCGFRLDDGDVLGAAVGNPHGHFEDADFVELHAATLEAQHPGSRGWIVTSRALPPPGAAFEARAAELAGLRSAKYPAWGWKDPRSTLFLEAWKACLPGLRVLLLWRPCLDVVSSLRGRARRSTEPVMQIGTVAAVRTWRLYNERALDFVRRHPDDTLLLSIPGLRERDAEVARTLRDDWGFPLDAVSLEELVDESLFRPARASPLARVAAAVVSAEPLERELERASFRS